MKFKLTVRQWLSLAVLLTFAVTGRADAESFITYSFQRTGPRQVIAVPTTYRTTAFRKLDRNSVKVWSIRLQTEGGALTRTYRVNSSSLAMQTARKQYPNSQILSVVKRFV